MVDFRLLAEALGRCRTRWGAACEKARIERCAALSLCRRTFKLKGNKSFVPEQRSRYVFFVFRDSYVLYMYVMNIPRTFRIFMYMAMVQFIAESWELPDGIHITKKKSSENYLSFNRFIT